MALSPFKSETSGGTGVAQMLDRKHLTLNLSSGLDLGREFEPGVGLHAGRGLYLKK